MPKDNEESENEIDSFLSHSGGDHGGGFLGNWKKNKTVNVFLHTGLLPVPIWFHPLPKKVVREEDGETVTRIWGAKYNCWEPEAVIKKQYKYRDDGTRLLPPIACPLCLLIEAVRGLIDERKLGWTQPLFTFEGDFEDEAKVLHAGGFIGEYSGNLSDEEKKALRKAGIKDGWSENSRSKLNYLFFVVDADNVEKGLQSTQETGLLGDKVKDVIHDQMESRGKEKGNPLKNPYCIQWEYREKEPIPAKKYTARYLERVELTDDIEEIIRGEKPDYEPFTKRFNADEIRSILEAACDPEARKVIPWDECFGKSGERRSAPATSVSSASNSKKREEPEPEADDGDDEECRCGDGKGGGCGKTIKLSDPKCPHCGLVFDVAAEEEEDKPVPRVRTRAEVAAEKKAGEKKRVPF